MRGACQLWRSKHPLGPDLALCHALAMGTLKRIAPIFPVHDLDVAMAHYQRLGFATRTYEGGGYGYATRDGIEIHLGIAPSGRVGPARRTSGLKTQTNSRRRGAQKVWKSIRPKTPNGASTREPLSTPTATSSASGHQSGGYPGTVGNSAFTGSTSRARQCGSRGAYHPVPDSRVAPSNRERCWRKRGGLGVPEIDRAIRRPQKQRGGGRRGWRPAGVVGSPCWPGAHRNSAPCKVDSRHHGFGDPRRLQAQRDSSGTGMLIWCIPLDAPWHDGRRG